MKELDPKKVALLFGIMAGGVHVVWSILVLIGLAEPLLNLILWLHMLSIPHQITGFNVTQSLLLIGITFIIGYAAGFMAATVWNKVNRIK